MPKIGKTGKLCFTCSLESRCATRGSVKAKVDTNEGGSRDYRVDQGDGQEQSALGSGTDSGRITETGYARVQTHDPEVHAARSSASSKRAEVGDLPA
jgi:hypothetical protein